MASLNVLLFTLVVWRGVSASPCARLEGQFEVLEQKLFNDSVIRRGDIEDLFQKYLNKSNFKEKEIDAVEEKVRTVDNETVTLLKRAFQAEKQFVRQYLTEFSTSQTGKLDERLKIFDEIQTDTAAQLKNVQLSYKGLEDRVSGLEKSLQTAEQNVNRIERLYKHFSEMVTDSQSTLQSLEQNVNELRGYMVTLKSDQEGTSRLIEFAIACLSGGMTFFEKSCYHVDAEALTWEEARQKCRTLETFLAEVDSTAEYDFLVRLAKQKHSDDGTWLGGSDSEIEGHWKWIESGKEITESSHWNAGEPNGGTGENCLHLNKHADFRWNDISCERKMGYICESKFQG